MSLVRPNWIVAAILTLGYAAPVSFSAERSLSAYNFSLQPRIALDHNKVGKLLVELSDRTLHSQIAESVGLTTADLKALRVRADQTDVPSVWVSQVIPEGSNVFNRFADQLYKYSVARLDGHTRECLITGLTNQTPLSLIQDEHLRMLVADKAVLPASWFKKVESGVWTNSPFDVSQITDERLKKTFKSGRIRVKHDGQDGSWASYTIIDGELAWSYDVRIKADGSLATIFVEKFDAKETMPEFKELLQEVDQEVRKEIEKIKTTGRTGDVRAFWEIKKEKLKSRGIEWRPREELNERIP